MKAATPIPQRAVQEQRSHDDLRASIRRRLADPSERKDDQQRDERSARPRR